MEFGNLLCLTENQLFCVAAGANCHFGHSLGVVAQWKKRISENPYIQSFTVLK